MPNIFYINPHNGICGGNKVVFEHCNHLAKRYQKCFIICDDLVPDWIRVNAFFLDRKTAQALVGPEDTVVFHWDYDAGFAMRLPALNKYYLIQHFVHLDEKVFKLPVRFMSVSSFIQKHTQENYGVGSELVLNGIDLGVFYPRPVEREQKRIFAIDRGGWKGVEDIRRAEEIVLRTVPEARFVYRDGLTPDEMAGEYSRADIYVSASWYEGFGLPVLEAMACGAAVVTTDSKGVDDFAFHEKNCLKTSPKDPQALASAILDLLRDQNKKEKFREEGLLTASRFAWDASIVKLAELFELREPVTDAVLFKKYKNVRLATLNGNERPYGAQIVLRKTMLANLRRVRGGGRLLNWLDKIGFGEFKKEGSFDYKKIAFAGKDVLYVPDLKGAL